jgi:hypothetical protein
MLEDGFMGLDYAYIYEEETGYFVLYRRNSIIPLVLKNDNAERFRSLLEIAHKKQDDTLDIRIERIIQTQFYFFTQSCPIPTFREE